MDHKQIGRGRTSSRVASQAAKILRDPKASKTEKSVAGSALVQRRLQRHG